MALIRIAGFSGEVQALHPSLLAEHQGTLSRNQRPGRGDLRSWNAPQTVAEYNNQSCGCCPGYGGVAYFWCSGCTRYARYHDGGCGYYDQVYEYNSGASLSQRWVWLLRRVRARELAIVWLWGGRRLSVLLGGELCEWLREPLCLRQLWLWGLGLLWLLHLRFKLGQRCRADGDHRPGPVHLCDGV
nr:hypothetical protein [Oxalobacteraceae bacterium]